MCEARWQNSRKYENFIFGFGGRVGIRARTFLNDGRAEFIVANQR